MQALTDTITVAEVSQAQPVKAHSNQGSTFEVLEGTKPLAERSTVLDGKVFIKVIGSRFPHRSNVA